MMNRTSIIFLKSVVLLLGIVVFVFLIWFPLTEGRAKNLDLLSIYADPFILYLYVASIAFFVALFQAFKLLIYIGQHKVQSSKAVGSLRLIKQCAILLGFLIVAAGIYIMLFHHKDDDPAGFLAMCLIATIAAIAVATIAGIFENKLKALF